MPTLEELLTMSEDNTCNINEESRAISVPKGLVLGVESDERTNRVYFRCKKIVGDNVDLTAYQLNVNYMNANGEKDRYIIEDINPDTSDTSYITFSWLLSRKVTKYKGAITFIVCALNTQADGRIKNEWNTTLAQANVLQGLEVDDIVIDTPQMDIINQLLNLVDSTVEQGKQQAISAIKAQGEEVQENISESVNTANTAKTDLETAINNASTTKSQLEQDITNAGESQVQAVQQEGADQIQIMQSHLVDYAKVEEVSELRSDIDSKIIEGKNKIMLPTDSITSNGLEISFNGNSIILSGDHTVSENINIQNKRKMLEVGKTYTLSGRLVSGSKGLNVNIVSSYKDSISYSSLLYGMTISSSNKNPHVTFTVDENTDIRDVQSIRFFAFTGDYTGCIIELQLEECTEPTEIEPFCYEFSHSNYLTKKDLPDQIDIQQIKSKMIPPLRMCIASDIHIGNGNTSTVFDRSGMTSDERIQLFVDSVNKEHKKRAYDLLLITGDICEGVDTLHEWKEKWAWQLPMPVLICRGNHDCCDENSWYRLTGYPTQYSFETEYYYFIVMDMFDQHGDYTPLTESDMDYIKAEVSKAKDKPVIICGHHFQESQETEFYDYLKTTQNVLGEIHGHSHMWINNVSQNYFSLCTNSFFDTTHNWVTSNYEKMLYGFRELEVIGGKLMTRQIQPAHLYPYYAEDYPDGYPYTVSDWVEISAFDSSNRAEKADFYIPSNFSDWKVQDKLSEIEKRLNALENA